MKISIITAFPKAFSYLSESIPKRAQEKGKVEIEIVDLKEYGLGKWKKIDDKPYSGGAGMVLMFEPIANALKSVKLQNPSIKSQRNTNSKKFKTQNSKPRTLVLLTSAKGSNWTQGKAKNSLDIEHLIIICGHYEGIDERVAEYLADEEICIGPYILSGGELASMVITDSIVRLIDGVVGNEDSIIDETSFGLDGKVSEYPHYTRPEILEIDGKKLSVPQVLLSGNHAEIEKWKEQNRVHSN